MFVRRAAIAALIALAALGLALSAQARPAAGVGVRVTVFGDSAATAIGYDPDARRILGRGIDLELEMAACRRVGDTSCPYDGVRPPNVIDRATELGRALGPVVVVLVGYNDYESRYAENIDEAIATFRKAGVERVLWATLRAERQSYLTMNEAIVAAARRYPEMTVLDWNALAKGHDDWVQADGIHLTAEGAQAMARMVNDQLVELGIAPKPAPPKLRPPLRIASIALPVGHRGRAYAGTLRATGGAGAYRWARVGGALAPGLRLTPKGTLTGIPTRIGTFTLRTRVVDRAGTARTRVFRLRIV
jgi:hypothetical protein